MGAFTKHPLQFLERVYKFVGGQTGPKQVDLDSPVVLVHDLGRSAEKDGPGIAGGWFQRSIVNVHPAADQQNGSVDPYAVLANEFGVNADELTVWCYDWSAFRTAGAGGLDAGTLFQVYPTIVVAFPAPISLSMALYGGINTATEQLTRVRDGQHTTVPVFVPPGATLQFTSDSAAAATFTGQFIMWAGARGVQPFIMSGRA